MNDDLSPILRKAYDDAPETATPSPLLWERTRRAFHARTAGRRTRSVTRIAIGIAAALVVGFVGGWVVGRRIPERVAGRAVAQPTTPAAAAERVQSTGSAYVDALDALVESLRAASAEQLATGQHVVLALSRAQAPPIRALLAGRPDSLALEPSSVIWF